MIKKEDIKEKLDIAITCAKQNLKSDNPIQKQSISMALQIALMFIKNKLYEEAYLITIPLCNYTMGPLKSKAAIQIAKGFISKAIYKYPVKMALELATLPGSYKANTVVEICKYLIDEKQASAIEPIIVTLKKNKAEIAINSITRINAVIKKMNNNELGTLENRKSITKRIIPKQKNTDSNEKTAQADSEYEHVLKHLHKQLLLIMKQNKTPMICLRNVDLNGKLMEGFEDKKPYIIFVGLDLIEVVVLEKESSSTYFYSFLKSQFKNNLGVTIKNKRIKEQFISIFKDSIYDMCEEKNSVTLLPKKTRDNSRKKNDTATSKRRSKNSDVPKKRVQKDQKSADKQKGVKSESKDGVNFRYRSKDGNYENYNSRTGVTSESRDGISFMWKDEAGLWYNWNRDTGITKVNVNGTWYVKDK